MKGTIRTGIGGWVFDPWRETFYPPGMKPKEHLRHAASVLSAIEINATFYRTQTADIFRGWAAEVPDGFRFAVKAARGAAQRKDAAEAKPAIERFLQSGLSELGDRLGPILWQLPAGRTFDADQLSAFLDLLPERLDGTKLRHALEAQHPSFLDPAALALLGARNVALVGLDKQGVETRTPITADFVYLRLQGTQSGERFGYPAKALALWVERLDALSRGIVPDAIAVPDAPPVRPGAREVFAFVIAGAKETAPAAAMELARIAAATR
ncbi:DUF72 domain-containing protein [Acetobacteraceae bacterium KSS8]|uniref:DUF72 domain-containing protein n=1 Tax=Endosaccharibacter trunci TaxID=2812733 RepID=A0ABT1W5T6_9PROT|nr:DUF72 domain-containing protein [Acetobacteraceae bacterium KSS8]